MSRLDLDLLTARLAPLAGTHNVAHIAVAASRAAAIERGRAVPRAIFVYRLSVDAEPMGPGFDAQTETIGVLAMARALATSDAGAATAAVLDQLCAAIHAQLAPAVGWAPAAAYQPLRYTGGQAVAATAQAAAWEDTYAATTHQL